MTGDPLLDVLLGAMACLMALSLAGHLWIYRHSDFSSVADFMAHNRGFIVDLSPEAPHVTPVRSRYGVLA